MNCLHLAWFLHSKLAFSPAINENLPLEKFQQVTKVHSGLDHLQYLYWSTRKP